jgi:hypothetical protein
MTRYAILGVLLVAAVGSVSADTSAQGPGTGGPALVPVEGSLDIGEVNAGQTAVAVFTFKNNSESPVRILRAKPS